MFESLLIALILYAIVMLVVIGGWAAVFIPILLVNLVAILTE